MKAFEAKYELKVFAENPFLIRLDGVRFSQYTKQSFFKENATTPFSMTFADAMKATATALLLEFHATAVYTSSDEITMIFKEIPLDKLETTSLLYSGRVQKLASVTAAFASVTFNEYLYKRFPERKVAFFDARVFSVPDRLVTLENIRWRAASDASRNSYQKLAQFHIGKRIQNLEKAEIRNILEEKNVDWEALDPHLKYGSIVRKRSAVKRCVDHITGKSVEAMRTETYITPLSREMLRHACGLMALVFE